MPIKLSDDFSKGTFQARRDWKEAFKIMKGKEQEQNHRNGDHMEGYQWVGEGGNGGKGTGNKYHKWQIQNRQGEVKNSMGNVEAKEHVYMMHGHELRWGNAGGRGVDGGGE